MRKNALRNVAAVSFVSAFVVSTLSLYGGSSGATVPTNVNLPSQFTVKGLLSQQDVGQPGCVPASNTDKGNVNPTLDNCTATGMMIYDSTDEIMYTEYTPCLPLLTPASGSSETCSFTFIDHNVYYVYEDQPMAKDSVPGQRQCCVIANYPMLDPAFPTYIQQYNATCETGAPDTIWAHAQKVDLYPTPGDPPGFYGYFPGATNGPPGLGGNVMPYGFGGMTPKTFSQMTNLILEAGAAPVQIPEECNGGDVDPCMLACVFDESKGKAVCGGQTLSTVFQGLLQTSGCALCHTMPDQRTKDALCPCPGADPSTGPDCPQTPSN